MNVIRKDYSFTFNKLDLIDSFIKFALVYLIINREWYENPNPETTSLTPKS
jgi:hypothetical protein